MFTVVNKHERRVQKPGTLTLTAGHSEADIRRAIKYKQISIEQGIERAKKYRHDNLVRCLEYDLKHRDEVEADVLYCKVRDGDLTVREALGAARMMNLTTIEDLRRRLILVGPLGNLTETERARRAAVVAAARNTASAQSVAA